MSLFKRREGLIGNCCTASASKIACRHTPPLFGTSQIGYEFVTTTKPRCAILRCSRAHLVEPHAVTQCARAHIKYTVAYSAFMFCFLLTLCPQSKVHKHLLCSLFCMSLPVAMSQVPTAKNTAGTSAALCTQKKRETSGRNRALLAGAACTWARSSAVTNTERSKPGSRCMCDCVRIGAKPDASPTCTWASSRTVINTERRTGPTRSTAAVARST